MNKKFLIIGAIPINNPKSIGGTTILVKQMLEFLEANGFEYIYIQTNRYYGKFSFFKNFIYVLINVIFKVKKVNIVIVNVSKNGAFLLSPILYLITKLFNKKFVFRKFGGNFISQYNKSKILKFIANKTFMKSDIMFFETKEIVNFVKNINSNTYWLPNTRKRPDLKLIKNNKKFNKRFVFISQIKETKGIDEIIKVKKILDSQYTIDLYGPILDNKYNENFFKEKNINYKGVLKSDKVYEVLLKYDVILLPTFHDGEGYPGIIIEGYSLGLPCITTKWKAIPEIVDDKKTGILINPRNDKELYKAIKFFNEENYKQLSKNALEKFNEFECNKVLTKTFNMIKEL